MKNDEETASNGQEEPENGEAADGAGRAVTGGDYIGETGSVRAVWNGSWLVFRDFSC